MHNSSATIYLSRHCKTAWNVEGRLQSTIDLPLAEIGIKQAIANVAVIRDLGVRRIVCSTARRAYETARLYADSLGLPIRNTPGLRELDHGKWKEGRRRSCYSIRTRVREVAIGPRMRWNTGR